MNEPWVYRVDRRIAELEAKIAEPHERLSALEAKHRAVIYALLQFVQNNTSIETVKEVLRGLLK